MTVSGTKETQSAASNVMAKITSVIRIHQLSLSAKEINGLRWEFHLISKLERN